MIQIWNVNVVMDVLKESQWVKEGYFVIGIVSFATFFATFLSQGVGMKQQAIIQDVLSSENLSSAKNMLKQVVMLTFTIEAIGAIAVFLSWSPEVNFYSPLSLKMKWLL